MRGTVANMNPKIIYLDEVDFSTHLSKKLKFLLTLSVYNLSRNRRVPRDIDSISANGTIIQCVKSLTLIGVIIDDSLDWKTHIKDKALKVSRGVGIMSKLKYVVPKKVLMCTLQLNTNTSLILL